MNVQGFLKQGREALMSWHRYQLYLARICWPKMPHKLRTSFGIRKRFELTVWWHVQVHDLRVRRAEGCSGLCAGHEGEQHGGWLWRFISSPGGFCALHNLECTPLAGAWQYWQRSTRRDGCAMRCPYKSRACACVGALQGLYWLLGRAACQWPWRMSGSTDTTMAVQ